MTFDFYLTEGCHLCDEAEKLLLMLVPAEALNKIDVADDDALMQRYGERIPVVAQGDTELNWPFSLLELQQFIKPS